MPFDIQGARNSGYSDDEIAQALAKRTGFDLDSATRAGYDTKSSIKAMIPRADQPQTRKPGFSDTFGGASRQAWQQPDMIHQGLPTRNAQTGKLEYPPAPDVQAPFAENADLFQQGGEAIGEGKPLTAVRKFAESAVPFLGPALDPAGNYAEQGNLPAAAGATSEQALLWAGPGAAAGATDAALSAAGRGLKEASRAKYQKALKPSTTARPQDVTRAVSTGLEEGLPVNEGGLTRTNDLIASLETKKDEMIGSAPGRIISPGRVATYTRDLESKFGNQAAPTADLNAIRGTTEDFYTADRPGGAIAEPGKAARNLTAREAQDIKQGTYKRIGGRAYGEQKSAVVETEKQIARALNDDILDAFPEMKGVNTKQGSAIELRDFLEHRVRLEGNKHPGGGLTTLAGGMGAAFEGMSGAVRGYGAAKAASIVNRVLRSPSIQSRIAIQMHKASKGLLSLTDAKATVAQRLSALGESPLGLSIKHVEGEGGAPAAAAEVMNPEDVPGIKVYHGSPHDFEKPDLSKIGTGEGAQAYGHGFYAAESPEVAGNYAKAGYGKNQGDATVYMPDGKRLTGEALSDQLLDDVAHGRVKGARLSYEQPKGNLYEAEIPRAAAEKMLDWDKPLSEQPAAVREVVRGRFPEQFENIEKISKLETAIKNTADKYASAGDSYPDAIDRAPETVQRQWHQMVAEYNKLTQDGNRMPTGGESIYRSLGGDQAAADALRDAGIPGIKYLDGMSRGINKDRWLVKSQSGTVRDFGTEAEARAAVAKGQLEGGQIIQEPTGTHNYVLFDVDVLKDFKKRVEIQQRQAEVLRQHKAKKATGQ